MRMSIKTKPDMKCYSDYKDPKNDKIRRISDELTEEEFANVEWTKFFVVVPTEEDKKELQKAFKYIHNSDDFDSEYIALNQIGHLYLNEKGESSNLIVVDKELYDKIEIKNFKNDDDLITLINEVNRNRGKNIYKGGFELNYVELTDIGLLIRPIQPPRPKDPSHGASGISGFTITNKKEMIVFLENYLKYNKITLKK
jgi:hypothetical protein